DWLAGPLGDQLERLRRGARAADLDEVDGGPAPLLASHLRHRQTGLSASLACRPRAQVDPSLDRTLRLLHIELNLAHQQVKHAALARRDPSRGRLQGLGSGRYLWW